MFGRPCQTTGVTEPGLLELTTAEIASELYISTNTVKSHIKKICHKLPIAVRRSAGPDSFS